MSPLVLLFKENILNYSKLLQDKIGKGGGLKIEPSKRQFNHPKVTTWNNTSLSVF